MFRFVKRNGAISTHNQHQYMDMNTMNIDDNDDDEDKVTVKYSILCLFGMHQFVYVCMCGAHTHHIPLCVYGKIEPAGTSKRFNFNSNRVSFLCLVFLDFFLAFRLPQLLHLLY